MLNLKMRYVASNQIFDVDSVYVIFFVLRSHYRESRDGFRATILGVQLSGKEKNFRENKATTSVTKGVIPLDRDPRGSTATSVWESGGLAPDVEKMLM